MKVWTSVKSLRCENTAGIHNMSNITVLSSLLSVSVQNMKHELHSKVKWYLAHLNDPNIMEY